MKILIIEDEVKTVQSLKKGLEERHMFVDFAYDGFTGKMLAERGNYDVIISDVIMPQMNGFEVVRHLRHAGIATPVLLLTALGATDDKVIGPGGRGRRLSGEALRIQRITSTHQSSGPPQQGRAFS